MVMTIYPGSFFIEEDGEVEVDVLSVLYTRSFVNVFAGRKIPCGSFGNNVCLFEALMIDVFSFGAVGKTLMGL
jgi:hypothetical protein